CWSAWPRSARATSSRSYNDSRRCTPCTRRASMKSWFGLPITGAVAGALLLTACVTINVYFPAAEAKEAAREFVEKVIEEAPPANDDGGMAWVQQKAGGPGADGFDPWMLLGTGSAHAQSPPDINSRTPAIQSIQSRMEARFNSFLRDGFNSGALV